MTETEKRKRKSHTTLILQMLNGEVWRDVGEFESHEEIRGFLSGGDHTGTYRTCRAWPEVVVAVENRPVVTIRAATDAPAYDSLPLSEEEREVEGAKPSVMEFWYAYPLARRTGMGKVIAAWSECIDEGASPEVMAAKAREYAESQRGRSKWAVSAFRFLEDRMFLDPPEAWVGRDESSDGDSLNRDYDKLATDVDEGES